MKTSLTAAALVIATFACAPAQAIRTHSGSTNLRRTVGRKMLPHSIAMVVHILNRAALRL